MKKPDSVAELARLLVDTVTRACATGKHIFFVNLFGVEACSDACVNCHQPRHWDPNSDIEKETVQSRDVHGRIRYLREPRSESYNHHMLPGGYHSACNICEMDMPNVWDTVCFGCRGTHCYTHSHSFKGHWYCSKCAFDLNISRKCNPVIEDYEKLLATKGERRT